MIQVRASRDRGHFDFGWLDTRHTFSFGDYHDPRFMGFRVLRVINEDLVKGGKGFPTHPHRDMEIVTYVVDGAVAHKDSMGTGSTIRPGDVQRMSAGTGVTHSEFNPSPTEPLHLLQIWILPDRRGHPPSYEQKAFPEDERRDRLRLVASPDGAEGSVRLHQDARIYASTVSAGRSVDAIFAPGRYGWLQIVRGRVKVAGFELGPGDGAAILQERKLPIAASEATELLLFDLP